MKPLILIVEDEAPLAEMLRYNLDKGGFRTKMATTGEEALHQAEMEVPDLAVVDWMLPERSGIEVCREFRARSQTKKMPIIMLTARGEEGDRILGLEAGADDYVVKPYSPREMVARIRALLRRSNVESNIPILEYADIALNTETYRVTRDGKNIEVSPTGFKVLQTLLERPEQVFSRERLLSRVWGGDIFVEPRTIDVHIKRLRSAMNAGGKADLVRTVRGVGYALDQNK